MKQKPNISVQSKSNTKLDYLKYLAEENIQPNISEPIVFIPKGKTKSKPSIGIKKEIDINKINELRIDLIKSNVTQDETYPIQYVENQIADIPFDYNKYIAGNNQQNISNTPFIPAKSKTKSKPNIKIQTKNLDAINKHRIDMMNWANREYTIFADLLIEYPTYYVLTITSYKLLFNNETPTAKDFDIYCDGLLVDKTTYDIKVGENVVITIQKSEAVDDHFDETNFEIVSKWDWNQFRLGIGDSNGDGEEDWLDTELGEDITIEDI
jgi:hypothetical protein